MYLDRAAYYDLNDSVFGWRGRYRILKQESEDGLVYIMNLGTGSKQHVSVGRLRLSRCPQFEMKGFRR